MKEDGRGKERLIVEFYVCLLQGEDDQAGIIPRLCKDLFVRIDRNTDSEFSVEVMPMYSS